MNRPEQPPAEKQEQRFWSTPTFWIRRPGIEDEAAFRSSIRSKFRALKVEDTDVQIVNSRGETASVLAFISDQAPALVEPFEVSNSLAYHLKYKESWVEDLRLKHLARLEGLLRWEFKRLRERMQCEELNALFMDECWKSMKDVAFVDFVVRYYTTLGFQCG